MNAEWAKTKEYLEAEAIRIQEEALIAAAEAEFLLHMQKENEKASQNPRKHNIKKQYPTFPWRRNYDSSQIIDALRDIAKVDSKVNNSVTIIDKVLSALL